MKRFKVWGLLIAVLVFCFIAFKVYADMTDKATLGGQDSSGNYSWRVDANNHLIPGTTAQNNIGSSTNKVATVYATSINTSSGIDPTSGINWNAFPLNTNGVNWTGVQLSNSGINWTDIQQAQMKFPSNSGINWGELNTQSGGVNWTYLGGQAVQGQLACWNMTNGRIGKCVAVSGTTCTTCN